MRFLYCLEQGAKRTNFEVTIPPPADPKKTLGAKLKAMVDAGKITNEESIKLYLTAFPEEKENVEKWIAGLKKEKELRQLLEPGGSLVDDDLAGIPFHWPNAFTVAQKVGRVLVAGGPHR